MNKQEQTMEERFWKKFPQLAVVIEWEEPLDNVTYEVLDFIRKELQQARQEERERIVEIVRQNTPSHITRDYRETDSMRDDIIKAVNQGEYEK